MKIFEGRRKNIGVGRFIVGAVMFLAAGGVFAAEPVNRISVSVNDIKDIRAFIDRSDSLAGVSWEDGKLILRGTVAGAGVSGVAGVAGGAGTPAAAADAAANAAIISKDARLNIEVLAAIYQAYGRRKVSDSVVQEKYAELLAKNNEIKSALKEGRTTEGEVKEQIKTELNKGNIVGFSLDPEFDGPRAAEILQWLLNRDKDIMKGASSDIEGVIKRHEKDIKDAIRELKAIKSSGIVNALNTKIKEDPGLSGAQKKDFEGFLKAVVSQSGCYYARYYGGIDNTLLGMRLYETDLLAKVWAINYQNIAPKGRLKGFVALDDIDVPKDKVEEMRAWPETRLWFGIDKNKVVSGNSQIAFEAVVMRVFAASSNKVAAGAEAEPNYQSKVLITKWNEAIENFVKYDIAYSRLNEIEKWSYVFMVAGDSGVKGFECLGDVKVPGKYNFYKDIFMKEGAGILNGVDLEYFSDKARDKEAQYVRKVRGTDIKMGLKNYTIYGGISLAKEDDVNKDTKWNPEEVIRAREMCRFLAKTQKETGKQDETIFLLVDGIERVVRVSKWSRYLVKSEYVSGWIELTINSDTNDFDASGDGKDSFKIKILSENEYNVMSKREGNKVVVEKGKIEVDDNSQK